MSSKSGTLDALFGINQSLEAIERTMELGSRVSGLRGALSRSDMDGIVSKAIIALRKFEGELDESFKPDPPPVEESE